MKISDRLDEILSGLKHDPEREDNWSPLTEILRDASGAEDLPEVKERLDSLIAYFDRYADWDYVVRLLQHRLDLEADGDPKADIALRLARINDGETFDGKKAKDFFEEVLRLRPGDREASEALEQLKEVKKKWRDVVEQYLREAHDSDQSSYKSNLYLQVAGLYSKFGGKPKEKIKDILHYLQLALEADPSNKSASGFLKRILVQDRQWEDLVLLYQRLAEVAKTREDRVDAMVQRARILAGKMDRQDEAAQFYSQVLELHPGNHAAMAFLVDYYTASEQSDHLIALYEDILKTRPKGDDELAILLQVAMVHWRLRGETDKAELYFRKVRRIQPNHPAALNFYRTIYAETQDWTKLVQILTEAVRGAKEQESKIAMYREIAQISQEKMGNLDRAIDAYKAIAKMDPENPDANRALKDLYRSSQKWNALLDELKREAQAAEGNVEAQVGVLREIVGIYRDHLNLDPMVIKTYHQILEVDPGDGDAIEALGGIYEKSKRWNDLIGVLEKSVALEGVPARKVEILRRITSIWIDGLSNYNKAVEPLEQILEIEPANLEVISQLKRIYEQRRSWEPLLALLRKELDLIDEPRRLEHISTMAQIAAERLGRQDEAIDLYFRVLELAPGDEGILATCEKLCERQKRWEDLARVLEARLGGMADDEQKVPILMKLGAVYGEQMGELEKSVDAWTRLLSIQPSHPKALRILRETYVKKGDWDSLVQMFARHENWEGLADVLNATSESSENPADRVRLSFKAAEIYEEKLGNTARAVRCWERVLQAEPGNREAALALLPVYEREQSWARAADMQASLLETAGDDAERIERLRSLVDLHGEKLRDARAAFETASRAFRLAPEDGDVYAALALYGEALGEWGGLVTIYRERLARARGDEAAHLRHAVAEILFLRIRNNEEALAEYKAILAADSSDRTAYDAIEQILTSTGRLDELIRFYEGRLESIEDPELRVDYWRRMAKIAQEGMDDTARAGTYYARILEVSPDDVEALGELETIYRITERWEDLLGILERKRELARGDDVVDAVLETGKVLAMHLGRPAEAIESFAFVLDSREADRDAVEALETLLMRDDLRLRAAELLEPHLASLEKFSQLVNVKKLLLEATEDPDRRMELQFSLAAVHTEGMRDETSAYDVLCRTLDEFPSSEQVWKRIEALAESAGRWEDLRQRFESIFRGDRVDDDAKLVLGRRLATLCEERLNDPQGAEGFHRWIFERDPLDETSSSALEAIFTGADRYADLRSLYRDRVQHVADVRTKMELLQKIGFLEEDVLARPTDAITTYREMLDLEPRSEFALRALERLYETTESWSDLADLLESHIDEVPADSIVAARYRLGDILDRRLGERARALEYYRQVLDQYPTHLKAQEALGRLLEDPGLRQEVASILEGIFESQGAFQELARVLKIRIEGVADDVGRVELLLKLAEIQDKRLRDGDGAYESLARALRIDPGNDEVRALIEIIVEQHDLWAVYVEETEEIAGNITEARILGPILFSLGTIYLERLSREDKAFDAYSRYIDSGHGEPQLVLKAARALEKICAARENYRDLVRVLSIQLEHIGESGERVGIMRRIGEIQEVHLEAVDDAIRTYLDILDLTAGDTEAMFCLERLFERAGRWEDLIGILERRAAAGVAEEEALQISFKVAEIYRDRLGNLEEAIFTYLQIAEKAPSREALETLASLYERTRQDRDLIDILDRLYDLATDAQDRTSLLFRAGTVERERTGDLPAAVDRFRRVLDIDPTHAGGRSALEALVSEEDVRLTVARILGPIYEKEQSFPRLMEMIDVEIAEEQNPADRDGLLRRAAEVAEVGLGDASKAFGYYARALRQVVDFPDSARAVDDLERISQDAGRWSDLVELYSQVAPDIYDPELQLRLHLRIAQLQLGQLANLDAARDWYVKVLDIAADNMEAVESLERIYWQKEAWTELLEILRRKTSLISDPAEKVSLLFKQAEICEEKIGDDSMAIEAYEDVLQAEENRDAVHALERLYERTERWGSLKDLIERQLEWPDAAQVALHHRLGKIISENLGDPQAAIEHFQEALRLDPNHEPTIGILEKWLEDSSFREQVAHLLWPIYLSSMRFDRVQAIIRVQLEFVQDPALRKDLFRRSGEIYEEQLEDLDKAFSVYATMFREDPEDLDVRANVDRLANVLDIWPQAAETFQQVLDGRLAEDGTTAELARHLGMIYDNYCGSPDGAIKVFRRALVIDSSDQESFSSLEVIFNREERWEDLFNLYRDVADGTTDMERRRSVLYLMGQLCEARLADRGRAIDIYREVLDIQADDPTAVGALERLFYYEQRFQDLAELLHARIDRAGSAAEQLELKYRLATVYDEHLGDRATAIDLCEEILGQDSSYRDAVNALESILGDPEHRMRVAQILIPHYKQIDDWRSLVHAYRAELEFLADPVDRIERLREIAEMCEARGKDSEGALGAYSMALLEDPGDVEILGHVQRLGGSLGRWGDVVGVLTKALEKTDMSSVRSNLLRLGARILDRHLGDFNEAVVMYRKLLEEEEGDMEALEALDSLYTLLADWEGLLWALDLKVQYTIDQEAAKTIRRRQGEVCEDQLGDPVRSIGFYTQALEADPSDLMTLESLERLYVQAERWEDLDSVLQQKLSVVQDPAERREVLLRIAAVHQEKLENYDQAIAAYVSVLEEFPADVEVMRVLDSLFAHMERWDDLYLNLDKRLAATQPPAERLEIQLQMAQLLTEALGDVERAIETYRRIIEESGENEQAFEALEAIAKDPEHRVLVIAILEPIYRKSGNWDKLLSLQGLQLEILSDPAERVDLLMQMAELFERGLKAHDRAFATYLGALAEDVWDEELYHRAEILAEALGRWEDFARALDRKTGTIYDTAVATDVNLRLGRIWEEKLHNTDKAIEAYGRIVEHAPDPMEALDALDRLYHHGRRWEDLVRIIEKKLEIQPDVDQKNELGLRLGEIRDQNFKDVPGAVRAYSEVLERTPANADAIAALEAILDREEAMEDIIEILGTAYRLSGNFRKLVDLFDLKASILQRPDDRVAVLRDEARIAEEDLQDPETAFQAYGKALWEAPDDRDLMDELERLGDMLGGWEALSEHVARILAEQEVEADVRKDMVRRLAGWAKDRLQDPTATSRWYAEYLEVEPDDLDAIRAYEASLEALGRDGDLIEVFEKHEKLVYDFEEKREVLRRIAEIATNRLGDLERAARAYAALVELDETDIVAVDALVGIRTQKEDWDQVIELMQIRLLHTPDPAEANAHRHRLVDLYRTVRQDSERAIETLAEILSVDPEDEPAARMLEDMYEAAEKWFDLKELVVSRMDRIREPAVKVHTLKRLADLSEKRFDDLDDAIRYTQEAYRLDPIDPDILGALERLLVATERLDDLISLLEDKASSADAATRLALLVRIGEIYSKQLGDAGRAIEYYEKVLEHEPNHLLALGALADLHEKAGDWERCISVLDQASQHADDTRAMGDIFYRIGVIKRDRLDDMAGAIESFNAVLEVFPEHPEIMGTLKKHFESERDWGRYASILEIEERLAEDIERKIGLLTQLAGLMRDKLGAPDQALAYLEQANDLRPGDVSVLTALVDAYISAGRTADAVPMLRDLIGAEEGRSGKRSKQLAVYHHRLGQAYERQGDVGKAVEEYEMANRIDLTNFSVNFSLGRLYKEQGQNDAAMKMLRPLLLQNLEGSEIDKADVYHLLAQLHLEKGEKPKALSMLERGLAQNPDHEAIKSLLSQIK